MRHIILGLLMLTVLLAGAVLLGAYALPWLMSAQQAPGPEQELPMSNSTSVPKDMNALVRPALCLLVVPPSQTAQCLACVRVHQWGSGKGMGLRAWGCHVHVSHFTMLQELQSSLNYRGFCNHPQSCFMILKICALASQWR